MKGTESHNPRKQILNEYPRSPANKAKHLNRAAAEYTQLLYHASKARSENCAFVDEIQWVCETFSSRVSIISSKSFTEN